MLEIKYTYTKHTAPFCSHLLINSSFNKVRLKGKTEMPFSSFARPQDPCFVLFRCLSWSGTTNTITLDGVHPLHVDKKLADLFQKKIEATEDEPSNEDGKTGTIGSVLIATVAFAAAFTVPGGFIADDNPDAGTAILAKKFAFRAFVVSDTMAFASSIIATSFLIYGAREIIPRNHRSRYNTVASGLVPVAAQFLIAAFAFAFHLVLGHANRGLIIFVYTVSLATVLFCFPGIWGTLQLGLAKAVWRRAGWRGLVNLQNRPSGLVYQICCFATSLLFDNYIRRPLFVYLISASFIVAIALNIALPSY